MNPPSPPSAVSQSVLLFDSDVNARNALKKMISIYQPNLQVVGESETEDGFRIRLENDDCDLAIIDVRSPDDPIFETLNHFPDPGFHIIFTTANKDFPPEAFRYKAVGYLFKPVESKAFAQAVETLWNREYRSMVTYMMALLEKEQKDQQHSKAAAKTHAVTKSTHHRAISLHRSRPAGTRGTKMPPRCWPPLPEPRRIDRDIRSHGGG